MWVNGVVNDSDVIWFEGEALGHVFCEVASGGDEEVHLRGAFRQDLGAAGAMGFGQGIEEGVFPLEHTDDRRAQLIAHAPHHAHQQGV
jgi:hypothetical protein